MEARELLERSVGKTLADRICESLASAQSFLKHPEPQVRSAALVAIADIFEPNEAFKDACKEMILRDPDCDVRKCAIASLFLYYRGIDDAGIGKVAAMLTYDNSQPRALRHYAYQLLFELYLPRRITVGHPLSPRVAAFRFPEDVDWTVVDSFLYPPIKRH